MDEVWVRCGWCVVWVGVGVGVYMRTTHALDDWFTTTSPAPVANPVEPVDPVESVEPVEPSDPDQAMEHYSNRSVAATLEAEAAGVGERPLTEGGRGSSERLNTAVQESGSRSNRTQSNLVVSFRTTQCRTDVFISLTAVLYCSLSCTVDSVTPYS